MCLVCLQYDADVSEAAIIALKACPKIQTLNLKACFKYDARVFVPLAASFYRVRPGRRLCVTIHLLCVSCWGHSMTDNAVLQFRNTHRALQHLDLGGCQLISDSTLSYVCMGGSCTLPLVALYAFSWLYILFQGPGKRRAAAAHPHPPRLWPHHGLGLAGAGLSPRRLRAPGDN